MKGNAEIPMLGLAPLSIEARERVEQAERQTPLSPPPGSLAEPNGTQGHLDFHDWDPNQLVLQL
ncbi:MAG TPA: hypothetical protein VJH94_02885 [Candidatus Paceibacterota bacterium]